MPLEIHQFPCLDDNFGVLIHDTATGATASIDAPDADRVLAELNLKGWKLGQILTTHHHQDHVGGNLAVKAATGCTISGPAAEQDKIPGIDHLLKEGDTVTVGNARARVIATPGHTLGHITFYFAAEKVAFVGDTLFSMGCGRILEGTPPMMWGSLQKLMAMPPETAIYCGHEYTEANAKFSLRFEPGNATLVARANDVSELRRAGKATLPTTLGAELAANPFLRAKSPEIRKTLGLEGASDGEVFAKLRDLKNKG